MNCSGNGMFIMIGICISSVGCAMYVATLDGAFVVVYL
jgi:hypothetical protein